jgi:hypothetical protein
MTWHYGEKYHSRVGWFKAVELVTIVVPHGTTTNLEINEFSSHPPIHRPHPRRTPAQKFVGFSNPLYFPIRCCL